MNLDQAIAVARREYADKRPRSRDWLDRARTVQPGGNTRSVLDFAPFPFRVADAKGRELHDVDGHRYIDLLGNYTAGLLGHSPGPVVDAVRAALDNGLALGSVHVNEVRFAELLVERFEAMQQVRFTNSGTEANLLALAAATHHTERSKIVVFVNGYHGGVLTFGGGDNPVNVPHDWVICHYNDLADVTSAFDEHGADIAAVLVEPMQGSGGCIAGTVPFLSGLRDLCDTHGSLLIFDEVMTSRFSTGGAQGLLSIRPDLTTLGKYLAGGLTFGAFGGRADVMRHFDPTAGGLLGHAGTFNNNVLSMAAGVATLTEILTEDVLRATHQRGDRLRMAMNQAFEANGLAMHVSGVGSLMSVHGTTGPVTCASDLAAADDRLKELFFFHCLDAGFYLARRGFIALSLEITDGDIDAFLDIVQRFDPPSS
ncbi:MAG: aspartate aminotransferase family protein [Acidimicrobiales bacterium]